MRTTASPEASVDADVDVGTQHAVEQFLYREADLLDRFELEAWLDLVDDDVTLEVPVRVARTPGSERPEFSDESFYMREDYEMLRERVGRLAKEYAWSENPRSRVRHVLGNVRVLDATEDELTVANNQHVFRSYGDTADHDLLSAQRHTVLRPRGDDGDGGDRDSGHGFTIARRTVYLDHAILNTKNLTLPLL
ncbi:aromatic-ring-hydroxylating dioxygenase subunit beta [Salinigranum sp. GCM10025319]|uniref:aromatic-ring-hydroxylating dioxygenase subunit beta n=1 Tax=Salinigranum sp. GCM10025319 TaxID=3252687 RepID=UPI0036080E61